MKKKKGGLLNNLELKIQATQELLNQYEKKLKSLENDNSSLNFEYEMSYKIFWERDNNYKELELYRLSILYKIGQNNYEIVKLENCNSNL